MKRAILHLVVTLCVIGSVRADQTMQSVQQALKDQGFYYGNVTGEKSAETTAAVRRYQIRNGLQVTGEMNSETLRSLNLSSNLASRSQPTSKPAVTQSNSARPDDSSRLRQNWSPRSFVESDRQAEMDRSLAGAPYESAPPRINMRIVAEVKRQLVSRGYYRGRINGRYGRRAAFAVRAFQSRSGIPPTGQLDASTLEALGLAAENLAYLESTPWQSESWLPVDRKFKHGKWKVKLKKYHRDRGDEYGEENVEGNGDGWWHGDDHAD